MRFLVDGWHRKHIGQFYICTEVFQPSKSWSFEGTKAISLSPVALDLGCWHLAQFNWRLYIVCPLLSGSTYRSEPEASSREQEKNPCYAVGKIKTWPDLYERGQLYYLLMRVSYCYIRQLLIFCKTSDVMEIEGGRGNQHPVIGPKTSPKRFLSMLSPNMASKMW